MSYQTDARAPRLRLITPPASLPVSVDEVKRHLRIRTTVDDQRLEALIAAAVRLLDPPSAHMSVCMAPQTWAQTFDHSFPACIVLDRRPVIAVETIKYVDTEGTLQTLAADAYDVFLADGISDTRVLVKPATVWPSTQCQAEAVTVTFSAGYPAGIPDTIKTALLFVVEDLYRNVEREGGQINGTASLLLGNYRRLSL